jgi:hypothetical protein
MPVSVRARMQSSTRERERDVNTGKARPAGGSAAVAMTTQPAFSPSVILPHAIVALRTYAGRPFERITQFGFHREGSGARLAGQGVDTRGERAHGTRSTSCAEQRPSQQSARARIPCRDASRHSRQRSHLGLEGGLRT